MKLYEIYKVKIIDEDISGNGITRIDNIVVFVKNALLNEELEIKIIEINKNYAKAIINKIITPSKERIEVVCPNYNKCGGCNFLHTNYLNERTIKKQNMERLFNRKIDYIYTEQIYNYRNKVTLHILNGKIGQYNDKTHELCEIDNCKLLNPKINETISKLNKINLSNISEIMIRSIQNKTMINIIGNINNFDIETDSLYINNKYIKGDKYLVDEINNIKYTIYPESFYQINKEGMINIYNKAKEYIKNANNLLDLYCGTGTIGIWMKDKFINVTGVEINESSIKNANLNKKLNNLNNFKFICTDAKNIKGQFDTIIVDPPRSGLSKDVIKYLNNTQSNIIYISCNPKTLKRDIDLLNNYELKNISICDMFPRTKHVESVVILERIDE